MKDLVAIDLLRALAAMEVALSHIRGGSFVTFKALPVADQNAGTWILYSATHFQIEAVLVFFVLSGFLVFGATIENLQRGCFDCVRYFIDRATRIFLPLIPACILTAIVTFVITGAPPTLKEVIVNMSGLTPFFGPVMHENLSLWTLSYEIWFYTLGGAIGAIIAGPSKIVPIIIIGLCVVVFTIHGTRFASYWLMGGLTIFILRSRHEIYLAIVGGVACAVGAWVIHGTPSQEAIGQTLVCVGVSFFIPALCLQYTNELLRPIARIATAGAAFSYSLYLSHYPVNSLLGLWLRPGAEINAASMGVFAARILICVGFAVLFYWCFERNTDSLRRTLRSALGTPRTT